MSLSNVLRKVPEITIIFWVVKLLTTALGESTSDFLVYKINPYLAVALGGVGLAVALILQFRSRRYLPWIYWLTVVMVAIFGTMAADALHIQIGVSYLASTCFFAVALAVIFLVWYMSEKNLSIHHIDSPRRELFYWATVMATFALGTAAGDMAAFSLHLGYFSSILLFGLLLLLIGIIRWLTGLNAVCAFWAAYILTRPLGASVADWLGKPSSVNGLGLGDGLVSLGLVLLIIASLIYMTMSRSEIAREQHAVDETI